MDNQSMLANALNLLSIEKQQEAALAQFEAALLVKDYPAAKSLREHMLKLTGQRLDAIERKVEHLHSYRGG